MNNIFNKVKVQIVENDIVRFEYCPDEKFSDQESLFVPCKKITNKDIIFTNNDYLEFEYQGFKFTFSKEDPLNTLNVLKNNIVVYQYREIKNNGELPLPNKTPEVFPLMDSPRLLIPEEGYQKDNSGFILQKDTKDLYLLLCNKDYLKLRKQYISLTGRNELPTLKTFGLFSSRYFKYSQKTAMEMIRKYESYKIPLDTFIVDTDWRDMEKLQGCGYTVNTELFPDIKGFFKFAHQHNLQVMMNDHPLPLKEDTTVLDPEELEYRQSNLEKLYAYGLDGWWYDRNWTCKLNSVDKNIESESLGNFLFNDVTKHFNLGFTLDPDVYKRNLVMSNINNVQNGIYKGMLDSTSHKYSLQWSGDTWSDEWTLRNEIQNLNKCANNMLAYYSSDIGGHEATPNKQQYIRWFQYGALSPILRPHCTCTVKKFREPWNYDKKTLEISSNFVNMRYSLLNVFYTAAYKHVDNGLGICSPLYLLNPDDKKAYKEDTSYMLGNSILVSPISGASRSKSLTRDNFKYGLRLSIYPNDKFEGKCKSKLVKSFTDVEKFFKVVKTQNKKAKKFSFRFKGDLLLKNDYTIALRNEVKARVLVKNNVVFDDYERHYHEYNEIAKIRKNKKTPIVIEAIQGRKLKLLDVIYFKLNGKSKQKIYLPEGEWFNIFHRNVYQGHRYIKEQFKLDEMPIFVKAGSLLALYKDVDNISKMSLSRVVYDYYTSKKEVVEDFFYEDDGISTAYKIGEYRKNGYKTYFKDGSYFVELSGSDKLLDDNIRTRFAYFKAHIRDNETIESVLLNGEPIRFKRHDHSKKAKPFMDAEFARDSKTLTFKFRQNLKDSYVIELKLRNK